MNDDRKGRGKELAAAVLKYVILISWALTTIIPLLWVFVNSFKTWHCLPPFSSTITRQS